MPKRGANGWKLHQTKGCLCSAQLEWALATGKLLKHSVWLCALFPFHIISTRLEALVVGSQEETYSPFTQEKCPTHDSGCQQRTPCCAPLLLLGMVWMAAAGMGPNVNLMRGETLSITCLMMLEKNLVPSVLAASSHYRLIGPRCSHCWNLLSGPSCYISVGAPWVGCLNRQPAWQSQRLQLHKSFSSSRSFPGTTLLKECPGKTNMAADTG